MDKKNWFKEATKESKKQKKRLTVDIDRELFTTFKAHCVGAGESMGSVVHTLLKKYLRENNIDFK